MPQRIEPLLDLIVAHAARVGSRILHRFVGVTAVGNGRAT